MLVIPLLGQLNCSTYRIFFHSPFLCSIALLHIGNFTEALITQHHHTGVDYYNIKQNFFPRASNMLEQQCEFSSCLEEEHTQQLKNLHRVVINTYIGVCTSKCHWRIPTTGTTQLQGYLYFIKMNFSHCEKWIAASKMKVFFTSLRSWVGRRMQLSSWKYTREIMQYLFPFGRGKLETILTVFLPSWRCHSKGKHLL